VSAVDRLRIGGDALPLHSFTLSISNNLTSPGLSPLSGVGSFQVSGTMDVRFASADLLAVFKRGQRARYKHLMRMVRPHMPKRTWRRLRARGLRRLSR